MSKRRRFLITSFAVTLGFLIVQTLEETYRVSAIFGLSFLTLILFTWSLKEGLGRNLTLLVLALPFLFTIGVGLFWFLLPTNIFTRIPVLFFYGFGIYSLCLTLNIYTVSTTRTIALLRAARGVGFVLTLVTAFLIYDAIVSIKVSIFLQSLLVFVTSFVLFLQGFWTTTLDLKPTSQLMRMSFVSSMLVAQVATILYFWPATIVVGSLFLTVTVYVLLGLGQARLEMRLFRVTVRDYLTLGALVLLGMIFATRWGGY